MIEVLAMALFPMAAEAWIDYFSQTIYLEESQNLLTQQRILWGGEVSTLRPYLGLALEKDSKTNSSAAFIDSQLTPLVGVQSELFFYPKFPLRFFSEVKRLYRLGDFPDQRKDEDWDLRFGGLGSGEYDFKEFFLSHYFSLYFTHLYSDRFIAEGWSRQGKKLDEVLSVFHELHWDSYDLEYDRDVSVDSRPGVKGVWHPFDPAITLEALGQYVYRWTNYKGSDRDEWRATLVFALYR
jgi:hypothetical protein